jgi:hypothetical protein
MKLFFRKRHFPISLKTAVFTTVYVINRDSEITLVSHELDGDWQFMGSEPIDDYEKVAKVVLLGEIIGIDKTVLKIADLRRGYKAERRNRKEAWIISKIEYSDEEITQMGFYCSTCGAFHRNVPMAYGAEAPFGYDEISDESKERMCDLTADICIINKEQFFIKGNLVIQVENDEDFSWNVWVKVTEADFSRIREKWTNENRVLDEPYMGKLATDLEVYPSTLNLSVKVHTEKVGQRPRIEVCESSHPLFLEQENGITKERVIEFARKILYSH